MAKQMLKRSEVPVEQTWDLSDLFPSAEAWEAELAAVEGDFTTVTQYKGRLGEGAATLLACLTAQEALWQRLMRVMTYASLRNSGDGSDPANQGAMARIGALMAKAGAAMSFVNSEILDLPEGKIEEYRAAEAELNVFSKSLEELLEQKPHRLSPETEATLAALSEVLGAPYMIYNRSKSSDIKFDSFTVDGEEYPNSFVFYEDRYEGAEDAGVRRAAWESFVNGLKPYQNTYAATWATEVKKNVVLSKLRKYPSVTHMMLKPHKVTTDVYENILNVIQAELAPHFQRYMRLRKKALGLDKLLYVDIKASLDPEYNPKTSYEDASKVILESLEVMGEEYHSLMKRALTERWVDRAENQGKSTGAFCSSPYGVHPYILISWGDTMRHAFVLTHELGHAGHFGLAMKYQRMVNTRPSTFFVEAPSTINELLLTQHLLKTTTDQRLRRWVINQSLGTYHHNFVTHLLEGELQRRIYGMAEMGKPITAVTLSETKGAILSEFWGDTVEIDEGAKLTWMRQPHYYMGFYPYTYAAGLTASTAVAQLIAEEGQPAVDRWLECLKAGGTMGPLELMKHAGVDLSSPEPIKKAVAYVGSLVDELEKSFN